MSTPLWLTQTAKPPANAVRFSMRVGTVEAGEERLTEGLHAFEADNDIRRTDGDATVPECLWFQQRP